jgi:hypothetical protein
VQKLAIGVLVAACAAPAKPDPHPAQPAVDVAAPSGERGSAAAPERAPAARAVLIDDGGVGDLRIGQPIPAQHLADDEQARARYELRWVADAQPFEAFRIGPARVLAVFHGPFTRWAQSNAGELDPKRFVDEAVRDARGGAPVESVVVDAAGPVTKAGIGVGSAFSDLAAAHPDAKLSRLPEWFESRPTCHVTVQALPRVAFHLSACGREPPGDVIRVLVSRAEE